MPVKCICKLCGKQFETYQSEIRKGNGKFCCSEHYHKWVSINKTKSGEKSNLWKDAKVKVTCKYCGKTNLVYKSQIELRGSNFCDRKCQSKWVSEHKSGKNSWNWVDKIKCICPICGKEHENQPSTIKRGYGKYCSHKCRGISNKGINNHNWNNGSSFGDYCYKFNYRRKQAVRNFFKSCILCEKTSEENKYASGKQVALSVHHIDHDKNQGCNGRPFNLVPLCVQCHTSELNHQEEYKEKINKILDEGFESGKWSREQYELEVMYSE